MFFLASRPPLANLVTMRGDPRNDNDAAAAE
jgi:hypothetical protein